MATRTAASPSALSYDIPVLTDRQRAKVREFFEQNPRGGYQAALRHAGLRVTKPVAGAIVKADDELSDIRYQAIKVSDGDALAACGEILADPDHKDRLRAALAVLAMLHGVSEKQTVDIELAGTVKVDLEDRSASLADVAAVLKQAGALDSGGAAGGEVADA